MHRHHFSPAPVQGLGTIGGFKLQVEDRAGLGESALNDATQSLLAKAGQDPTLSGLFSSFRTSVPQLEVDLDRTKAKRNGVAITDVLTPCRFISASLYVNDFNKFGRTYQVIAQADSKFRTNASSIAQLKTRNARGEMVPLGSVLTVKDGFGPDRSMHYNSYPSSDINGEAGRGHSSGEAVSRMNSCRGSLAERNEDRVDGTYLPANPRRQHHDLHLPLCVLLVFLVLAAQYESWSLPLVSF